MSPWQAIESAHPSPRLRCRCGVYAIGDPFSLGPYLDHRFGGRFAVHRVAGRVSLRGSVVASERGFRASHAYPAHLYVPCVTDRTQRISAEDIAAELGGYGVPVDVVPEPATTDLLGFLAAAEAR